MEAETKEKSLRGNRRLKGGEEGEKTELNAEGRKGKHWLIM